MTTPIQMLRLGNQRRLSKPVDSRRFVRVGKSRRMVNLFDDFPFI